jgi:hypothetical protein
VNLFWYRYSPSHEPVLNVDETGWRTNGAKRFLWAFVAARYAVYTVAATRGVAPANRLPVLVRLPIAPHRIHRIDLVDWDSPV